MRGGEVDPQQESGGEEHEQTERIADQGGKCERTSGSSLLVSFQMA